MFILKRKHEREINELKRKIEIARDVHRVDHETNRKIIMSLGEQVDGLNGLNESRVSEIQELNKEINDLNKSRQAWIQECMKKDQELEALQNELDKAQANFEKLFKENLTILKNNAHIFELKRQMKDKIESVLLCSMHKVPKNEVISKLSKKDVFELIELLALM